MQAGKALLQGLSNREALIFMQLTQIPALLTTALGLAAQFPAFSTVISNVPGPREQLYWNGASLDGIYPASIVFDGFAMNITLVSYNQSLDFGIVACRRSLPEVQRMIDYLEEALVELEEVAGLRTRKNRSIGGKKAASKAKSRATARGKVKTNSQGKVKTTTKAKTKVKPNSKTKTKTKTKAEGKAKVKVKAKNKNGTQNKMKAKTGSGSK